MDSRALLLFLNTLLLAGATCAVSVPLGTAIAWLLVRTDLVGRRLWLAMLGLMLFVPLYLQAAAWQAGFGLQGWWTIAGFSPVLLEGWPGAVWVHAVAAMPWVVLIVGWGFAKVERELEESALLDASPRQVFWHVTLLGGLPALGVATLWVALCTAGEMTVTDLFGVRTYAEEVYTLMAIGQEPGVAPLAVLPGVAMTAVLVAAGLILCRGLAPRDRPLSLHARGRTFRLGRYRLPVSIAAAILFAVLIGLPLGNLIYKAGVVVSQPNAALPVGERPGVRTAVSGQWSVASGQWPDGANPKSENQQSTISNPQSLIPNPFLGSPLPAGEGTGGLVRVFSPAKCLEMIAAAPWRHSREFCWSLLICPLAAGAAVLAAIPLAWLARRGGAKSLPALTVAAVALAVPGPVLGLAIIALLDRPELPLLAWLYDRSILAPFLALWVRGLPAAIFVLWYALHAIPRDLLELAAVDGAGPISQFFRIALPMRWPAVALAFLLSLAIGLGDLAASILVVPPGVTTLSIHIFGLLHYGVEDQVAGICLALLGLLAVVAAGAWGIIRGARGGGRGMRDGGRGTREGEKDDLI